MSQIDILNQNVAQGYLYIYLGGYIKLVNIKQYLIYLNKEDYQEGYKWVYDRQLKDIKLWSLEEIRQLPSILEDPIETTKPKGTFELPNETVTNGNKPEVSATLGGININLNNAIPYVIGFILLFFLFITITKNASQ
jgi:hypothetical protein